MIKDTVNQALVAAAGRDPRVAKALTCWRASTCGRDGVALSHLSTRVCWFLVFGTERSERWSVSPPQWDDGSYGISDLEIGYSARNGQNGTNSSRGLTRLRWSRRRLSTQRAGARCNGFGRRTSARSQARPLDVAAAEQAGYTGASLPRRLRSHRPVTGQPWSVGGVCGQRGPDSTGAIGPPMSLEAGREGSGQQRRRGRIALSQIMRREPVRVPILFRNNERRTVAGCRTTPHIEP